MPEIASWTLTDDTATANAETQRWLEEYVIPKPPEPVAAETSVEYVPAPQPLREAAPGAPPDVLELAQDLMARGRLPEAIQLLLRDATQQPSGRTRFLRRLQIAQLCLSSGEDKVAYPVLEELAKEIDQRRLEEWEGGDMIAPPLALLLRCFDSAENNNGVRETVFARLCRIDPIAAMSVSK